MIDDNAHVCGCNQKRKHNTLSIEENLKILEKNDRRASVTSIAKECDVWKSTVSDIKKNEESYISYGKFFNRK